VAADSLKIVDGRASGADIPVDDAFDIGRGAAGAGTLGGDPEISHRHARITRSRNGELVIQDLGSTNGTFVNGRRISAPEPLQQGASVRVGMSTLEVVADGARGAQATAVNPMPGVERPQPTTVGEAPLIDVPAPRQGAAPAASPATAATPPTAPATPPTAPAPQAKGPLGLDPTPVSGSGVRRRGVILGLLAALIVAGAVAAILLLSSGDESDPEPFAALAQGISTAEIQPDGRAILTIRLGFIQAPYGFRTLEVVKTLDARRRPPFPVTDGVYTMTDGNGDRLVLATEGTATAEGEPPDNFFARADENFTVSSGTGRFEGATGEGRVLSVVVLDVNGQMGRSAVGKHFVGELKLED
jgi:pSer/pThr/pTyr-binding forkhead associated (FHA) protein